MRIIFGVACVIFVLTQTSYSSAQTPDFDKLKEKPIAVGGGKVGELLRQWWKEGTAAGNVGDFYDNRDGDHSPLSLTPYPQLSAFKYSPEDITLRKHWAAARVVRPHVTFGNSSTSAPAHLGGSNPRSLYVSPFGLTLLAEHYRKNNVYIYPEHRDHDPGRNGKNDGFGDLYPTNTPYLFISQGSSGSDQPFMRMMPSVLAAFRPEVKRKLIETGTLMPTIQMLFRSTNKHLKDPKEYLTGKAHPSVFEGSWVDELAIVQKAHALELNALPPIVQMRVLEENKAIPGIDFIDLASNEIIGTTPACIARVHRSKAQKQRIIVSADASFDLNKSKLTYLWVILRGDADKIRIVPKKDDASTAEITVAYHERRPIAPGSAMESNRVDIGVFVHNGTHYSAPGFVTFTTLDREVRTYSTEGKPLEVAHGMSETDVRVPNWEKLLAFLANDLVAGSMLQLTKVHKETLRRLADEQQGLVDEIVRIQAKLKVAEKVAKDSPDKAKASQELDALRQRIVKAQKSASDLIDRKNESLGASPRQFFNTRFEALTKDPLFTLTHQDWLKKARTPANEARFKATWQRLVRFGIATSNETLTPLLPSGKSLADAIWTRFERSQLEMVHATLLADLAFPGLLQAGYQLNYVDHRLSVAREWRDVFRHDSRGEYIGWMRYSSDGVQFFNHEGLLAVEKDLQWRVVKGRIVRYVQDSAKTKGPNLNPLRMDLDDTIVRYEFDGSADMRGRRTGMEPVKDAKK